MMRFNSSCSLEKTIQSKLFLYSNAIRLAKVNVLISYSGGIDSSVLFHATNKLSLKWGFKFDFIYINHRMNPNSEKIVKHCKYLEQTSNAEFIYKEIDSKPVSNIESTLRNFRYNILKELIDKKKYNFVLTAHHLDDQLETIFMRSRGNYDWTNLLGIQEYNGLIRRPMLNFTKKQITDYAINNSITWFFDYTNNDTRFLRNNIRKNIFPYKNKIYFSYLKFLMLKSKLNLFFVKRKLSQANGLIIRSSKDYTLIDKEKFSSLSNNCKKIIFQNTLKIYNNGRHVNISKKQWLELWFYIEKDKNLNNFILSNILAINNSRDLIVVSRNIEYRKKVSLQNNVVWGKYIFKLDDASVIDFNNTDKKSMYLPKSVFSQGVYIRNWTHGDWYISSSLKKKKVSKLFIKNKFNNYQKMTHPIFVDSNGCIIWIPDLLPTRLKDDCGKNNNYIKISKEILN